MKRTEIHEVYYGSHTDAQVKDAMNAAILNAIGIAAPTYAPPTAPTRPERRTAPVMPNPGYPERKAARVPQKRSGTASRRVVEHATADHILGLDLKPVRDIAEREIQREQQSFAWRQPLTATEWLNGADGQYRSPYREQ